MDDWKILAQKGNDELNRHENQLKDQEEKRKSIESGWHGLFSGVEKDLSGYFRARGSKGHKLMIENVVYGPQFWGDSLVQFITCKYKCDKQWKLKAYLIIKLFHATLNYESCRIEYKFRTNKSLCFFYDLGYSIPYFENCDKSKLIESKVGYDDMKDKLTTELIKLIEKYESEY